LLKPIKRERLAQAVERAARLKSSKARKAEEQRIRKFTTQVAQPLRQIVARRRDCFVLLRLDQICFFIVEDAIVKVKTEDDGYWTDYQINDLEARLPEGQFFRARRSVIVNLRKVREIAPFIKSTYVIVMKDQAASEIQVSERQSQKLRQILQAQ